MNLPKSEFGFAAGARGARIGLDGLGINPCQTKVPLVDTPGVRNDPRRSIQ